LESATVDVHHAFTTDRDTERDAAPFGFPSSIVRE
jgi:hypothetical protein